ncbi:hypothetical protein AB1I63_02715 [Streptococcus pneumoniae]
MAQPTWNRTLSEVLQQNTVRKTFTSEKTGNEYETDVIEKLEVVSTGSVEEVDGKYSYSVVDTVHQLEYTIKTQNEIEVFFGAELIFSNVTGGMTNNGRGWYKADSVSLKKETR